jgi:hypothetical protein
MIPVECAPEPHDFDRKVRLKGFRAINALVARNGGTSKRKKMAKNKDAIPASAFPPYWREALPDMLKSYDRICAFLALYIPHGTGNPSVDHMLPKSRAWNQVYEWSNYRLCAATINARKRDLETIIDPFACGEGWFALEFVGFQVVLGHRARKRRETQLEATLRLLNSPECCHARETYVVEYEQGHIDLDFLERRAPFVARELRRQGRLRRGDT